MNDLKPGTKAEIAGQYAQVGASGELMAGSAEATVAAGETLPPSDGPGHTWRLVDASARKGEERKSEVTPEPEPEVTPEPEAVAAPAGPYVSDSVTSAEAKDDAERKG